MKELELNSDQKVKVAYLNETTSETIQDLTLILIMPSKAELGSAQPPLFCVKLLNTPTGASTNSKNSDLNLFGTWLILDSRKSILK